MKRIKQLLSLFIILLAAPQVMAQVISVCAGEDSVRLRLENYQYGKITWMRSYDNENWEIIENATDTVYKFLPEESMYYRAQVVFGDCEPVYSATSYVQTLPKPFAGTDKTLSIGAGIYLSASAEPGVIGRWDILSGIGGVLADDTSAYSFFYGTDTTYQLRWTMTNACGSRSDTLKIRYVETIYYDDIVYVDSTDQILSDSAERVNGLYRIIFSAPSVVVTDSSVLIGSMENSFFEKVEHMRRVGDTCIMETRPATLDDILVYGVLNATEVHYIDTVRHAPMPYIILDHLPTRAEMQIPEIRNGHYRIVEGEEMRDGNDTYYSFTIPVDFSFNAISVSGNFLLAITRDRFQFEYVNVDDDIHFKYGVENGKIKLLAGANIGINGVFGPHALAPALRIPLFGGVIKLKIQPYIELVGQAEYHFDVNAVCGFTGLFYKNKNLDIDFVRDFYKESFNISHGFSGNLELGLGVVISGDLMDDLNAFESLGPYIDVSDRFAIKNCVSTSPQACESSFQAYSKFKLGLRAIPKWKLFKLFVDTLDISASFSLPPVLKISTPFCCYSYSGDNQLFGDNMEWLPYLISVRVIDNLNQPAFQIPVHFNVDEGCGVVSDEWAYTNSEGIATTLWRPSPSGNDLQWLRAEVFGCSSSYPFHPHISGSPIYFQARKGNCSMDKFKITIQELKDDDDNIEIRPRLENNLAPENSYTWSVNDAQYSSTCPIIINPAYNTEYVFRAKNEFGCVSTCSYVLNTPSCEKSDLSFTRYTIKDNTVTLETSGGHPPYSYRRDNASMFVLNVLNNDKPTFVNLSPGEHLFQVQDTRGCIAEETITIGIPLTITFNPNCNDYTGTMTNQGAYCNVATSLQPNAFVRDGYSFIGWNTRSDGSGTAYADMAAVTLTDNTTLYAQWGNAVHRLILHTNGGQGSDITFDVECGEFFTLPQMADSHPCLTFREWNTRSDGMGDDYRDQATILLCAEMELYAIWDSVVAGTVFFYPNGADECGTMQQTFYKCSPRELLPYGCEYYAHVFNGWNTSADGTGEPYADRQIVLLQNNMSLYAQWRPADRFSVTFDANGGTGEMPPIEVYENESVQLPEPNLTKENHHFVYWNTASDGSGTTYYTHSYIQLNQNTTLFAQWEQDYYTVTFDANGGEGAMNPQRFYVGTPTLLAPNTFTHPSLVFSHWSTNESGNGTRYNDREEIVAESNFILYAQWTSSTERTSCAVESHHSNETVEDGRLVSVRDHEGNDYPVVQMNNGTCWLRTNVHVTTSPTTGTSLLVRDGNLYNWYAATDSGTVRGICPYGWHVPTYEDWYSGIISYGAPVYISGLGWDASNVANSPGDYSNELRNSTNFSLIPYGKYFINDCAVTGIGSEAWLWLNVNGVLTGSYAPSIQYLSQNASPRRSSPSASCYYLSVRCVRD